MKHLIWPLLVILLGAGMRAAEPKTASDTKLDGRFRTATFTMW